MLLLFISLLVIPDKDATVSWLRFRGPNGTGQASGFHWPKSWNQQAIRWKIALPGTGHGSPIVDRGSIYLQASDQLGTERLLLAINTSDGRQRWQQRFNNQRKAHTHAKNSLASGTAASDGERIFFCLWDGAAVHLVCCLSENGTVIWQAALGIHQSQHGAAYSPTVLEDKVYIVNDSDNHAEIFCFQAQTGKKVWSQVRQAFRASYSTPLVHHGHAGHELIVVSTAGITAYEPPTGRVVWNQPWPFANKPLRVVNSPLLCSNHVLLASSGDGAGDRDTICLKLPTADITEDRQTRLLWQKTRDLPYVTCLLEHRNHVYFVADKGVAGCLDLETGK
ncbi:MAG TPA: PQQ-like beta-propeller repeat protein, partial [Gemmatales bacterium]|nr:PQQ-like beta-propeller repeat protein [Gemmatales bacterium]